MGRYLLKTIRMTLDPSSISNAIREVRLFEEKLKPAMQCLIDYLCEKGVEVARAALLYIGGNVDGSGEDPAYMTGDLQDSITWRNENGTGIVTAGEGLVDGEGNGSYAIYVEYGTGIYGADVNGHGIGGWWYPAPWGTWERDGTLYAWTNGMPPRPFMQSTFIDLCEEAEMNGGRVIAEYIRGERA